MMSDASLALIELFGNLGSRTQGESVIKNDAHLRRSDIRELRYGNSI